MWGHGKLRIWFDVIEPKELLFFESIIERIQTTHDVLFTTGGNSIVANMCNMRNLNPVQVGNPKTGNLSQKLTVSLERAHTLFGMVREFKPDATVSFCSPEASRISFGLGVPHMGFSSSPHDKAKCKLSVLLLTKLFTPNHIPADEFTKYGINKDDIVQYESLDEFLIVRNKPAPTWSVESIGLPPGKKIILFKVRDEKIDASSESVIILNNIVREFPKYTLVVLTQNPEHTSLLKRLYHNNYNIIILNQAFDSEKLFLHCSVMVGFGGTMIAEAVLRGVPAVLCGKDPTITENYLIKGGALAHARYIGNITSKINHVLSKDRISFQEKASLLLREMQDPYEVLISELNMCVTGHTQKES